MIILEAKEEHLSAINQIAKETWYDVYAEILTKEQTEYMLEWMYSIDSLKNQINCQNHHFLLVQENNEYLGFVSYEVNYCGETKTKIHKIYISPNQQKKGVGRLLIDTVSEKALEQSNHSLTLNMNKQNNAIHFYKKMGFVVTKEECNDIGNGYVMDDYILERDLTALKR